MKPMESYSESQRRARDLERLLEAIAIGTIAEVDDLDEAQEALLRTAYPSSDDLQEIFDRIRGQEPEER
jgi:hypothetical protein